jgi:hypothetical protein
LVKFNPQPIAVPLDGFVVVGIQIKLELGHVSFLLVRQIGEAVRGNSPIGHIDNPLHDGVRGLSYIGLMAGCDAPSNRAIVIRVVVVAI